MQNEWLGDMSMKYLSSNRMPESVFMQSLVQISGSSLSYVSTFYATKTWKALSSNFAFFEKSATILETKTERSIKSPLLKKKG